MQIALKNIRTCQGMDGEAFSATVYLDGKRAGYAVDSGHGGAICFNTFGNNVDKDAASRLQTLEREGNLEKAGYQLMERHAAKKQTQGWCRNKTVFRLKGDKKDVWRIVNRRYSPQMKSALEKKFGSKLEAIGNESSKGTLEEDFDTLVQEWDKGMKELMQNQK